MIRRSLLAAMTAAAIASAACFDFTTSVTPSSTTAAASQLVGGWTSSTSNPSQDSCTDFNWKVTQTSGNTATGTLSATCFGSVRITGNASGVLSGTTLTWTASGTAVLPNLTTCPISLSGTAQLAGDTITVPFTGTTCLGPISGTETMKK